jgi:hypothetical protein
MSTTTTSPTSTSAPMAPPPPRRSAGQHLAVWLGALAALLGSLLALTGGAIFGLFGTDGLASTERHDLSTPTSALVSGTASFDTTGFVDDLDSARIRISARADGGRPVFVGIGPAAEVDRYLAGAPVDEVRDFDAGPFESFSLQRERRAGSATPAAPQAQDFWVARSQGEDTAAIDWEVRDGEFRVVVMNADGSRGVATQTHFGVDVPYIAGVGIGMLVAGLLIAAGGIAAITAGARRRGR